MRNRLGQCPVTVLYPVLVVLVVAAALASEGVNNIELGATKAVSALPLLLFTGLLTYGDRCYKWILAATAAAAVALLAATPIVHYLLA